MPARKYRLIEMPDRVQDRPLPEVEIIDMREEFRETGRSESYRANWRRKSKIALSGRSR